MLVRGLLQGRRSQAQANVGSGAPFVGANSSGT
jgi:hypothetical protein